MTTRCLDPDATFGVAYRLSIYLDCQARELGEKGFQALAGGALGTAMLSSALTLFVALIGYRMLLGHVPDLRDGMAWAVRLGIVLALVTSWPAFQTLVYRVSIEAPEGISRILLRPLRVSGEGIDSRVQQAYDKLRLGNTSDEVAARGTGGAPTSATSQSAIEDAFPVTASLFVISTVGLSGSIRMAIAFLLAVSPIAFTSLLFAGTSGLFVGWLRALTGLALGLVGATLVTAIHLVAIESEIAQASVAAAASVGTDAQALPTLVAFFSLVSLVTTFASVRMGSALGLSAAEASRPLIFSQHSREETYSSQRNTVLKATTLRVPGSQTITRATAISEAVSKSVQRDHSSSPAVAKQRLESAVTPVIVGAAREFEQAPPRSGFGASNRRSIPKRSRSAKHRDLAS